MSSLISPPALISFLIALTIHESAHAYAAYRLGDPTAKYDGRLTLNPVAHLDPLGTVVFLVSMMHGFAFGWAKPVPVNPAYFRHPKKDNALVALAGPASNLILAVTAAVLLRLLSYDLSLTALFKDGSAGSVFSLFSYQLLTSSLLINLGLMAFNLLPVPPLDGSKIFHALVPLRHEEAYLRYLSYGPRILILILLIDFILPFSLLSWWFFIVTRPVMSLLGIIF